MAARSWRDRKGRDPQVVLDVALRLEKLLTKAPGVEVILTRRTDEYVPLQERTAIANREGADLFFVRSTEMPAPTRRLAGSRHTS